MADLVNEFKSECRGLLVKMQELGERCESGELGPEAFDDFAMFADRIMGAAKQLALQEGGMNPELEYMAKFAQLCKLLGYKTSQLGPRAALYPIVSGILLDAVSELSELLNSYPRGGRAKGGVTTALLERLTWVNQQFADNIDGNVPFNSGKIIDPTQIGVLIERLKGRS